MSKQFFNQILVRRYKASSVNPKWKLKGLCAIEAASVEWIWPSFNWRILIFVVLLILIPDHWHWVMLFSFWIIRKVSTIGMRIWILVLLRKESRQCYRATSLQGFWRNWVMLVLPNIIKPLFLFLNYFSSLGELLLYILTKSLKAVELILLPSKKWCNPLLASKTGIFFPPHNHRFTWNVFVITIYNTYWPHDQDQTV